MILTTFNFISKIFFKFIFALYVVIVLLPVCILFGIGFYIGILAYEEVWSLFDTKFKKEVLKQRRIEKFDKFLEKHKLRTVFISPLFYKDLCLQKNDTYRWLDWHDNRHYTECVIDEEMREYQYSVCMNNDNFITTIEDIYE